MGAASSTCLHGDSLKLLNPISRASLQSKPGKTVQGSCRSRRQQQCNVRLHIVSAVQSSDSADPEKPPDPNSKSDDVNSWRIKAFDAKPKELGSTRFPHSSDYIDAEWQEFQKRAKANGASSGPASTSGPKADGFSSVEDSWDLADDYTPFPTPGTASFPTSDAITVDHQFAMGSNYNMAASSELWNRVSQVYVILFGVGKSETEGIYSLRAVTGNEGLPVDTIIAFESQEDAQRYAGLLEAAMLCHIPEVSPIESKDLLDFCADSGYNCRLEPAGTLLIPPEYNVGMTDWERSLRLREGIFNVLPEDPTPEDLATKMDGNSAMHPAYNGPTLLNQAGAYFPTDIQGLEELKAKLEKLLPED